MSVYWTNRLSLQTVNIYSDLKYGQIVTPLSHTHVSKTWCFWNFKQYTFYDIIMRNFIVWRDLFEQLLSSLHMFQDEIFIVLLYLLQEIDIVITLWLLFSHHNVLCSYAFLSIIYLFHLNVELISQSLKLQEFIRDDIG